MTAGPALVLEALAVDHPGQTGGDAPSLSLEVLPGELVAVLGPTGAGKTSLLRAVAGLGARPRGRVRMAGDDVTRWPPERRPSTLVFDVPVLLPDLSVAENVAFAVDAARGDRTRADEVEAAITALDLGAVRDRLPSDLSRGQRQRVALARALARRPSVLLLDEPLAHLDSVSRRALRDEIVRLHRRMRCATLLVTHDGEDALAIADRVVVLRGGRIAQEASPRELFARPASTWVAQQIGLPTFLSASVALPADPDAGRCTVELLGRRIAVSSGEGIVASGQRCVLVGGTRAVRVAHRGDDGAQSPDLGRIARSTFLGDEVELEVETDAGTATVRVGARDGLAALPAGAVLELELVPELLHAVAD